MRSVPFSTFFVSMLVASGLSAAATFAVVTLFVAGSGPRVAPPRAVAGEALSGESEDLLARLEQRLASLESAGPAQPQAIVAPDLPYRELAEQLRALQDRLTILEHQRGETAVAAQDGDTVAPAAQPAAPMPAPSNLDELIDARIQWLKEEEARKQKEAREQQMIENLERTREWYGKVYEKAAEVLTTELGLSAAQADTMRTLMQRRGDELLKMQDPRVPQEEKRQWNEVNKEYQDEVRRVLSPQQQQIYDEKKLGDFNRFQRQIWQEQQESSRDSGNTDGRSGARRVERNGGGAFSSGARQR